MVDIEVLNTSGSNAVRVRVPPLVPPMQSTLRALARKIRRALTRDTPLITVSISRENLLHNLHAYQERYPKHRIAPVLKSNAYGHGLTVVAALLDRENIAFFMVDSMFEARVLRRAGIRSRILVMGYVRPESVIRSSLKDTDYAITDIEQLRTLAAMARNPVRLHLKLDTGMHRQGIVPEDLEEAIAVIQMNSNLQIVGVATHLADADSAETSFTDTQLSVWQENLAQLSSSFPTIEYRHAGATKGAGASAPFNTNLIRVGMGLYGCNTSPTSSMPLKPVLSMRSFITSIREIPAGDSVGYNATFTAAKPSRIATVPAGYYEGIDRALSNVGSLQVNGVPAPIAGRVSMNMVSLDVTDIPAKRGDLVTLISRNPEDPNSVQSMARLAGTSPYVILAHIPTHLSRVVE
jgi:alanine racemase